MKKVPDTLCFEVKNRSKQSQAKKKNKGVVPAGRLKATRINELLDCGGDDAGYAQDYENVM